MRAPGAVVEPDHRDTGGGGQVHHLVDLLGEDLAEGAPEDGEVLAEDAHPPAVDGAEAGDHAVGVGPVVLEPHAVGPVPGQHVELLERPLVEQVVDPLPGGQLALGVVLLDGPGAAGVECFVLAFGQVGQAFGHGVFHAVEANAPWVPPEIGTVSLQSGSRSNSKRKKPGLTRKKARGPGPHALGAGPTALGGDGMPLLEVAEAEVRFGGVHALRGVDLDGRRGHRDRPHRPQRRRQDHVLQRHLRPPDHQLGSDLLRRHRHDRAQAPQAGPARASPAPSSGSRSSAPSRSVRTSWPPRRSAAAGRTTGPTPAPTPTPSSPSSG